MGSDSRAAWLAAAILLLGGYACSTNDRPSRAITTAAVLTPGQELKTFHVADGFRVQLVACEPMVQDPVAMTFDEAGRPWVVEMRGFMPDVDGRGEEEPVGRVSVLEDVDGDGRMDRSHVFLDGLVLPRAIAVVHGGALVGDQNRLWFARDTDGDGVADVKTLVDENYASLTGVARSGDVEGPVKNAEYPPNPEHSANGLLRGMDNWYYSAKSATRYRWRGGKWVAQTTELRGQWGITQDDFGRLFYNYNFSQLHGDLVAPGYLLRNPHHRAATGTNLALTSDQRVFPVRENHAINRAYREGVLDGRGRAKEVTSASAPLFYRGGCYGDDFAHSVFVCDPALNLIKRDRVAEDGLTLTARQAYADHEFLASADERFRPVWLAHGPEGAVYVADMYRGLIQHGTFVTPYLRDETLRRGLDKPIHLGRIWRIVPADLPRPKPVNLAGATVAQLVAALSHPNGWVRDTAQRLLVEKADPSAAPRLAELALRGTSPVARAHALWTLEGIGIGDDDALIAALDDPHPKVLAAATRVVETLARDDSARRRFGAALRRLAETSDPQARLQAMLSSAAAPEEDRLETVLRVALTDSELPTTPDAAVSSVAGVEGKFLERWWQRLEDEDVPQGRAILTEMLASAIVRGGSAGEVEGLLDRLDAPPARITRRHEALLAGVVSAASEVGRSGPVTLSRAPSALLRAAEFPDGLTRDRLGQAATLFSWPGHSLASTTRPSRRRSEAEQSLIAQGRTLYLQTCAACHGPEGEGLRPLGPPLAGSDWISGPAARLVRIVVHGLEGPVRVKGREYRPPEILESMPSLAGLTNLQYAAVLTYVRSDWGNDAPAVMPEDVKAVLKSTAGRTTPWHTDELLKPTEGR
jgi:putative membrane-bound dehydrogenase-like protein